MQNKSVSDHDSQTHPTPRFTTIERAVLASGAFAVSLWVGALAWVGYKLAAFVI